LIAILELSIFSIEMPIPEMFPIYAAGIVDVRVHFFDKLDTSLKNFFDILKKNGVNESPLENFWRPCTGVP
jgi:hypothetical protein